MNAGSLIGQLLQAGMARNTGSRMDAAARSHPGVGDLLGNLLGDGARGSQSGGLGDLGSLLSGKAGSAGGLGGLGEMASQYLGQARQAAADNPKIAAGGLGAVVGSLLGGGKVSSGLGGAAIGVIGMIAMNALQNAGQSASAGQAAPASQARPAPPSAPSPAASSGPAAPEPHSVPEEAHHHLLLQAMISAAKADGHVDEQEMNTIVGKLKENDSDPEERDWVLRELSKPLDVDALVAAVPGLEVAAQVYAASILAITADTPQEVAYLDQLATKLNLQPAVRSYIHQSLGLPLTS